MKRGDLVRANRTGVFSGRVVGFALYDAPPRSLGPTRRSNYIRHEDLNAVAVLLEIDESGNVKLLTDSGQILYAYFTDLEVVP